MELFAPGHLLVVLLIVLLLFGGRKIPELMRGLGEGVRSFKEGLEGTSKPVESPPGENKPASPSR
jgi:sec-independent protein translocase protein TatA